MLKAGMMGLVSVAQALTSAVALAQTGGALRFDVRPVVRDGTTLVQMRPLFEYLGAKVTWKATTRQITATKNSTTIVLAIGSRQARVNGQGTSLAVAAQTIAGHTMIPLRFVSESLGTDVEYHGSYITLCDPEGSCTKVDLQ